MGPFKKTNDGKNRIDFCTCIVFILLVG